MPSLVCKNTGSRDVVGAPRQLHYKSHGSLSGKGQDTAVCFCPVPRYLQNFSNALSRTSISQRTADGTHRTSVKTTKQPPTSVERVFKQRLANPLPSVAPSLWICSSPCSWAPHHFALLELLWRTLRMFCKTNSWVLLIRSVTAALFSACVVASRKSSGHTASLNSSEVRISS